MARWTFEGVDRYIAELNKLSINTGPMIERAVYEGAGLVADAVRANIEALPAVPDGVGLNAYWNKEKHSDVPLTESAKQGLLDGFGITEMEYVKGYRNVKLGFDGYNNLRTRNFPNGQPNLLIARRLERGSSVSKSHPFMKPAVTATWGACEQRMMEVIDEEIKKQTK